MRTLMIVLLLTCLIGSSHADEVVYSRTKLFKDEKAGVRFYMKGKYEKAYERLLLPAQSGLKNAQYYLGFMYLKGQHVTQSLQTGMAWLGVANEVEIQEWQATFDQIYNAVSEGQRKAIDKKISQYIDMYGMEVNKLRCSRQSRLGSRKVIVNCLRNQESRNAFDSEFF
jgi:hypothetical protein